MNIISKIGLALAAVAFTANANAEEWASVEKVSIAPGETKVVSINFSCEEGRNGCDAAITLPEGISFVEQEYLNADEETVTGYAVKGSACYASHNLAEKLHNPQYLKLVISHMQLKNLKTSGVLFTIQVKADENFKGEASGNIDIKFNTDKERQQLPIVFSSNATGIASVEAPAANGEVYDAAGVRKPAVSKGLNIIRTAEGKAIKVVK